MNEIAVGAIVWIACIAIVAFTAKKRGQRWLAWMFYSIIFSPFLAGIALLILPNTRDERAEAQWSRGFAAVVVSIGLLIGFMAALSSAGIVDFNLIEKGFSESDIATVKSSIKEEFEKRENTKVLDVQMMRESKRKLVGFAKIKIAGIDFEISKSCSATYGDRQYIWECK